MKRIAFLALLFILPFSLAFAGGYEIGDKATDFSLINVDGSMVSMSNYTDAKGFILIFTCNHCPYSVAYEDRKIELDNMFRAKGYPVIAINPNDPEVQPKDSFEKMQERAAEKNFPFPYVLDDGQHIYPQYGATRTPHVYVVQKSGQDFFVRYIGAIDDNHQDADAVKERYVVNAVEALLAGKEPPVTVTKAIGCTIKTKKK
jgi:peroxiredoxin